MSLRFEKPLSNQDFFNKAWQWLIVYNIPQCMGNDGNCLYRHEDGRTCIIGAFIPDDLYHPSMENKSVALLKDDHQDVNDFFSNVDRYLMKDVQNTHDTYDMKDSSDGDRLQRRKQEMVGIARKYKLVVPE